MAQLKTSQYPTTLTVFRDEHLLDVSYWDGISAFTESQKLTWGALKTELDAQLNFVSDNLYTANGTIGAGRIVTLTDTVNFTGGFVGIGKTPTVALDINGAFKVQGNIANQLFVSNTASFVGVKSVAPLSTEAFRVQGEMRASGVAIGSASVVGNRYAADAGGSLKFGNAVIKEVSGYWHFESSINDFRFRNSLNTYSLFELNPNDAIFESPVSSVGTTIQSHNTRITSNYWTGSNNVNIVDIKNTALDLAGAYKLGFEVGGSERMSVSNTGQVNMSSLPTSNPGGSGNLWSNGGNLEIT